MPKLTLVIFFFVSLFLFFSKLYADPFQDALDQGVESYLKQDYSTAIKLFTTASQSKDKEIVKTAYCNMGWCYNDSGKLDWAISSFEKALSYDANYRNAIEGLATSYIGDKKTYEKSILYARKAEDLFSVQPGLYYNMACYYGYKGDAETALRYIDKAMYYGFTELDIVSTDQDLVGIQKKEPFQSFFKNLKSAKKTQSSFEKAVSQKTLGDYAKAKTYEMQALDACRIALGKDSLTESKILAALGLSLLYTGEYDKALDFENQGLEIQKKILGKTHPDFASFYNNIGFVCYYKAQYSNALNNYQEAYAIQSKFFGEKNESLISTYYYITGAHIALGDYTNASESIKKSISLVEELYPDDVLTMAMLLGKLGSAYGMIGKYEEAAESYNKALSLQIQALGSSHPDVGRSYTALGGIYTSLSKNDQARKSYDMALQIQQKIKDPKNTDIYHTYKGLGDLYYNDSQYAKSLELYLKAQEGINRILGEDSTEAAKILFSIAAVNYSLGQYNQSRLNYEKAAKIWTKAMGPEYPEVARCLLGLGVVLYTQGLYDDAFAQYSKALEIQLRAYGENSLDVAKNYLGIGVCFYSKGEYSKALGYYEKAVVIQKKLLGEKSIDLARSYLNMSTAYFDVKNYAYAIKYVDLCYDMQYQLLGPDHLDLSVTLNIAASILIKAEEYQSAMDYYSRALSIQEKVLGKQHQLVAETKNNMGVLYNTVGSYDNAIRLFQETLSIKKKIFGETNAILALDYHNIGMAYYSNNKKEKALENFQIAQKLVKNSVDRQLAIKIAKSLGLAYYEMKNYKDANNAFKEGILVVEKARIEVLGGKTEITARNYQLYNYSFLANVAMGDLSNAFEVSEMKRARGYLDRLSLTTALNVNGISENDRKKALDLNEQIAKEALWQMNELHKPENLQDKSMLITITDKIQKLETEFRNLDNSLMLIPGYKQLREPEIAKLIDVQKLLSSEEVILDFIIDENDLNKIAYCLVINKNTTKIIKLNIPETYSDDINAWMYSIIQKSKNADQLGYKVYEMYIAPLESELFGAKKLIIVPSGRLSTIPFDALKKDVNNPYLGQKYLISLVPSISVLISINNREYSKRQGDWMGFGGVKYNNGQGLDLSEDRGLSITSDKSDKLLSYYAALGSQAYFKALNLSWKNLPGTKIEVESISQEIFEDKKVILLLGESASKEKIIRMSDSGELALQRIIHFACHGYFDVNYPEYSALVFSETGGTQSDSSAYSRYLTVEDIALLKLNADLVTLSACETGLGFGLVGDGIVGFTRSFLVAGANRLTVTIWTIDDEATKEFMIRFYTLIEKEGMDYAMALAQVKREFIQSEKYSDPYYWAGFVLYGR